MKGIRIATIIIFSLVILLPVLTFNFEENAVSLIDNRELTKNPFTNEQSEGGDLTDNIENYVNDRIGLRDEMILSYTVLNDKVFHKMVHPSYTYGEEGYVFGEGLTVNNSFTEYHIAFADMVKEIQDYCDERNVPFIFVFNPAKPAVLTEYIPEGTNYDRSWVDDFFDALDEREVRYVNNTEVLRDKTAEGEIVFNQKYDANHWNDLGAFYGTNSMLSEMKKDISTIHINEMEEFVITETLQTTLPVSEFPINENVPTFSLKEEGAVNITEEYSDELERAAGFAAFGYYVNNDRIEENAPKALVFQGSYMNGFGYKFLSNAFGEYIYVHDYQNVIDFAYYYNIFQPDCVIFEVAEYTFSNGYFDYEKMCSMNLNPVLDDLKSTVSNEKRSLELLEISYEKGEKLTKIKFDHSGEAEYTWINLDKTYDMKKTEVGYEVTVLTEKYDLYKENLEVAMFENENLVFYTKQ